MSEKQLEIKRTRVKSACVGCRQRKQKCDGERPMCAQCRFQGSKCDWPVIQRRGPPKRFSANLVSRLERAEAILLNALPLLSDDQLQQCFRAEENTVGTAARSRTAEEKYGFGLEYWQSFPLDTLEDVRKWQLDRTEHDFGSSTIDRSSEDTILVAPGETGAVFDRRMANILNKESVLAPIIVSKQASYHQRDITSPSPRDQSPVTAMDHTFHSTNTQMREQSKGKAVDVAAAGMRSSISAMNHNVLYESKPRVFDAQFENDYIW